MHPSIASYQNSVSSGPNWRPKIVSGLLAVATLSNTVKPTLASLQALAAVRAISARFCTGPGVTMKQVWTPSSTFAKL